MGKDRLPRKLKKKIPKDTFYCYEPDNKKNRTETGFSFWIKPCKFYRNEDGLEGYCNLLKCGVTDQVKECGERGGKF